MILFLLEKITITRLVAGAALAISLFNTGWLAATVFGGRK